MSDRHLISPGDDDWLDFDGLSARPMIDGSDAEGRLGIVEIRLAPRALAAPLHLHQNEDEFTCVLAGRLGAMLDGAVVTAEVGEWLRKPRKQWHTYWNPDDETECRLLEFVTPAGFERYFADLARIAGNEERMEQLNQRYQVVMDFGSIATLREQFGLTFPVW